MAAKQEMTCERCKHSMPLTGVWQQFGEKYQSVRCIVDKEQQDRVCITAKTDTCDKWEPK
jgi:hypothetical protein